MEFAWNPNETRSTLEEEKGTEEREERWRKGDILLFCRLSPVEPSENRLSGPALPRLTPLGSVASDDSFLTPAPPRPYASPSVVTVRSLPFFTSGELAS